MTKRTETTDVDTWLERVADDPAVEATDASDLREIGTALIAIDAAEATLKAAVSHAREAGRSWTEIANVLGVSRQAARQRFGMPEEAPSTVEAKLHSALDALAEDGYVMAQIEQMASALVRADFVRKGTSAAVVRAKIRTLSVPASYTVTLRNAQRTTRKATRSVKASAGRAGKQKKARST